VVLAAHNPGGLAALDGGRTAAAVAVAASAAREGRHYARGRDQEAGHVERILCRRVIGLARLPKTLAALACVGAAALASGCSQGKIDVPKEQTAAHQGAVLFNQHCSGCHTLDAANAYGSKPEGEIQPGERTNGPNFNVRHESRDDVLFAIRNGGFSGAIMPANVVVGREAQLVAAFLEKYSGKKK
jgi:mono/diheme cytochrome c family protein